ncbi:methylated-DNA--[protein]-cysteine S-methyltransferase [Candidatus Woesearchaeota archaeon]|nr:methylated-DNA--[protein]-cysteine S-methyltransferase [Candidatus Woesearchaeota archaeon]
MNFSQKVWKLCSKIPEGRVTTYREIAKALNTKAYRAVGNALRNNPDSPFVPCHRVVKSSGEIGGYKGKMHSKEKIRLLREEGIQIKGNKIIDFKLHKF